MVRGWVWLAALAVAGLGITTLVFVGKGHLNQALNFAIAAEMYWSP